MTTPAPAFARPLVRTTADVERALFDRMIDEADLHFGPSRSLLGSARNTVSRLIRDVAGRFHA